jgi:WD40 repeat protein
MKALRELIDYFLSRGSFTQEEIRLLKEKGYLKQDENYSEEPETDTFDAFPHEMTQDDILSADKELEEKRTKGKSKASKANQLSVSELNYRLREEFKKWNPELETLLILLSELHGNSKDFRSLSIGRINEDSLKPVLIHYLANKPEFMKSLWRSISFDGYLELISIENGIGARIYDLICQGENLMNLVSYRFCLNYKYIKLFQCIVLSQRLVLKTLRVIFNEDPSLVFAFLRRTGEMEIINSFLLYDMVSHNLLELNKVFCIISGDPYNDENCMKFETSGNGKLFLWGLDRRIEKLDLKSYSRKSIEDVFCEPEFCINAEGNLLAFYRKPFENGRYRNVQKISFLRKNSRAVWRRWKEFRVMETDPSGILLRPKGQSIIIATSAGDFVHIEFSGKRKNLGAGLRDLAAYVFSPRGDVIFLAGQFLESNSTQEISAYTFPEFRKMDTLPLSSKVTGLSISQDGNYLALSTESSQLIVWNLTNGKVVEFTENKDLIVSLSFGSHEDVLASLSSDKVIRLWDVKSHECFQDLDMKKFGVSDLCKDRRVKGLKVSLLRNDLIYQDDSDGLFIFKLHIVRETHVSGFNRHIGKWIEYLGKFCWGRIDFDKKTLFNAITMDCGENTKTYNLLINNEVSTLIFNKPAKT